MAPVEAKWLADIEGLLAFGNRDGPAEFGTLKVACGCTLRLCGSTDVSAIGRHMTDPQLTGSIIGAAIEVHRTLGPGLLESAYEECLARELALRSVPFERQKPLPLVYKDVRLDCGYRLDLLVRGRVVVEVKAVEYLNPIHDAVVLTYLRLSGCKIGLIINFHTAVLKDGIRRLVWQYEP